MRLPGPGWSSARARFLATPAEAANFPVTSLADDGSAGTLRDALTSANANADADTITFASGLTGTVTLAGTLPISASVDIQGPGANKVTARRRRRLKHLQREPE